MYLSVSPPLSPAQSADGRHSHSQTPPWPLCVRLVVSALKLPFSALSAVMSAARRRDPAPPRSTRALIRTSCPTCPLAELIGKHHCAARAPGPDVHVARCSLRHQSPGFDLIRQDVPAQQLRRCGFPCNTMTPWWWGQVSGLLTCLSNFSCLHTKHIHLLLTLSDHFRK